MRRYSWMLAVVCFLAVLASPLIIGERYASIVAQNASVHAASPDSFSLSAPVRLLSGPRVDLERGTISVPAASSGLARGGEVIAMLITGSGPQLTLDDAVFTVDFSGGEPTINQSGAPGEVAPLVKALQAMQFDGLKVRDSIVRIKLSDGSVLELHSAAATISSKPNGAMRAVGSFIFRGETVSFDTMLGPSLDAQGMSRPLKGTFSSPPLNANLDGSLLLGENPQFRSSQSEIRTPDLRAAARWLGVDWPAGHAFGQFQVKGQLEWAARTIAFQNAAVALDNNNATGTLSVNFSGPRPMIEGTLGLKTLNLSHYMPDLGGTGDGALLAATTALSGAYYPLIQAIDADFRLSADSVSLPKTTLGHSAATVALKDGKLLADIAELEIDDGTRGGGQLRIDVSGANPRYGLQAKLESPDVSRAVQAMFGHPTVQGRGLVTIDLTAAGNTGDNLLRSLHGKLSVTLLEPGRVGFDVNRLAAANPKDTPPVWKEVGGRAIAVEKLDVRFLIANGIMRTQSAEAVSGKRALTAYGTIDLPEQQLDMELAVGEVTKDAPPGTGELRIKKRDIIKMQGPWTSPAVRAAPAHADSQDYGPPNPNPG